MASRTHPVIDSSRTSHGRTETRTSVRFQAYGKGHANWHSDQELWFVSTGLGVMSVSPARSLKRPCTSPKISEYGARRTVVTFFGGGRGVCILCVDGTMAREQGLFSGLVFLSLLREYQDVHSQLA